MMERLEVYMMKCASLCCLALNIEINALLQEHSHTSDEEYQHALEVISRSSPIIREKLRLHVKKLTLYTGRLRPSEFS
jgi:hypothetical protein